MSVRKRIILALFSAAFPEWLEFDLSKWSMADANATRDEVSFLQHVFKLAISLFSRSTTRTVRDSYKSRDEILV